MHVKPGKQRKLLKGQLREQIKLKNEENEK
jgi:hypothetical protein